MKQFNFTKTLEMLGRRFSEVGIEDQEAYPVAYAFSGALSATSIQVGSNPSIDGTELTITVEDYTAWGEGQPLFLVWDRPSDPGYAHCQYCAIQLSSPPESNTIVQDWNSQNRFGHDPSSYGLVDATQVWATNAYPYFFKLPYSGTSSLNIVSQQELLIDVVMDVTRFSLWDSFYETPQHNYGLITSIFDEGSLSNAGTDSGVMLVNWSPTITLVHGIARGAGGFSFMNSMA